MRESGRTPPSAGEADTRQLVAVVGGGITGLAAARALAEHVTAPRVVVLDMADTVGGKLRTGDLVGVPVEAGAESLLVRRPEAVRLARSVGLADRLVPPTTFAASLLAADGVLRPLPTGTMLGIPGDREALAASGVLTETALRAMDERDAATSPEPMLGPEEDVSVGTLVRGRMGSDVLTELVEPLLGGVYAGDADRLSLAATMPQLAEAVRLRPTLGDAVRSLTQRTHAPGAESGPLQGAVFAGLVGGIGALAQRVADHPEIDVRTTTTVRAIEQRVDGWQVTTGSAAAPEYLRCDAVVLALPGPPMKRLLGAVDPTAAAQLDDLSYASVALVAMAFPRGGLPLPPGSGFLVPPARRRVMKAVTFLSRKWRWVADSAPDVDIVRVSVGRAGETDVLQRDDGDLTAVVLADLLDVLRAPAQPPVASQVTRWGGSLPQYSVGHVDRVAALRRALGRHPGIEVAGAALDGVGIPACIASGQAAAGRVLAHLASVRP